MNQSLIFSDSLQWNAEWSSVHFVAQQQGMTIDCYISRTALQALSGEKVHQAQQAMVLFEQFRFDIEDKAEKLIEQEAFDELGRLFI